jgi:hypothetical protein
MLNVGLAVGRSRREDFECEAGKNRESARLVPIAAVAAKTSSVRRNQQKK